MEHFFAKKIIIFAKTKLLRQPIATRYLTDHSLMVIVVFFFFAALLLKEVSVVAGREYNLLILRSFWCHNVQLKTEFNLRTLKCYASRHSVLKEFTKVEGKRGLRD